MKRLFVGLVLVFVVFSFGVVGAVECSEADYDGDGDVDFADLFKFRQCYNKSYTENCSAWDFGGDGFVGDDDLASFTEWYQLGGSCPVAKFCEDSDGGLDYLVKGTESTEAGLKDDYCLSADKLVELYCVGDEPESENYNCPNGCYDGACVMRGYTSVIDDLSPPLDFILMAELENGLKAGGTYQIGDVKYNYNVNIKDLHDSLTVFAYEMRLVVIIGKNVEPSFVITADEIKTVLLGLMDTKSVYVVSSSDVQYDDLKLLISVNNETATCSDSDGGADYDIRGTITGASNLGGSYPIDEFTDTCQGDNLLEGVCLHNVANEYHQSLYMCANGCVDGACVSGNESDLVISDAKFISNSTGFYIEFVVENIGQAAAESYLTRKYNRIGVWLRLNEKDAGWTVIKTDSNGILLDDGASLTGEYVIHLNKYELDDDQFFLGKNSFELFVDRTYNEENIHHLPYGYIKESNEENNLYEGSFNYFPSIGNESENGGRGNGSAQVIYVPNPDYVQDVDCDNGCFFENKCFNFGYRKAINKSLGYCFESGEWLEQKSGDESCENSFECDSNLCIDDECISAGFFRRMMNWFSRLFS